MDRLNFLTQKLCVPLIFLGAASKQYQNNPVALQLRGMNMLFEGLKEKGSLIIVPSSALDSMNLGAIGGLAGLARHADAERDKEGIE